MSEEQANKNTSLITFNPPPDTEEKERYWVNEPYAMAVIVYDKKDMEMQYFAVEPELTSAELTLLEKVYDDLQDILTLEDIMRAPKEQLLYDKTSMLLDEYGVDVSSTTREKLAYYIQRNQLGYGKIDMLMRDPNTEDISCNRPDVPIFLYHIEYQNIKTNVFFDENELEFFVNKLAQRSGKHISVGEPMVNATLPDGSRLQATFGREVTSYGSSFTIRKFREDPFTPPDLIGLNTCTSEILAYLWMIIENNKSMIFAGGTASGKTTSLNATSLFIPPTSKVVSIEDTREITLYHENWTASVTRESVFHKGEGAVDMYELLRQALRQRPEYIIVGEVRGNEALTLFQAMSTGHTTYSTIHASDVQEVINRLENEPINVPPLMINSLDLIGIQSLVQVGGKRMRRLETLTEIVGIDPDTYNFRINEVFTWNQASDRFEKGTESEILRDIMQQRGWSRTDMDEELYRRRKILDYLVEHDIRDYKRVAKVFHMYHLNPDEVMKDIEAQNLEVDV